jgi:hypothetical protein
MFLETHRRLVARAAWVMAWAALVVGQLHALARYRTEDGKGDLKTGLVGGWAPTAHRLLSPLLDWGTPDAVYVTYGKIWFPVFLAFTAAAFLVRRRRRPAGFEKWAWRVALTGYVAACVTIFAEYWTMWTGVNYRLLDGIFLATIPAMLLTILGSTVLGVVLVRKGAGLPGWLLVLALPGFILIPMVTSLGSVSLPISFAFGVWGRRIAREGSVPGAEVVLAGQITEQRAAG